MAGIENSERVPPTELPRGDSHPPRKESTEVRRILESEVVSDLRDGHRGITKLTLGFDEEPQVYESEW
jgi:hypothetical protein